MSSKTTHRKLANGFMKQFPDKAVCRCRDDSGMGRSRYEQRVAVSYKKYTATIKTVLAGMGFEEGDRNRQGNYINVTYTMDRFEATVQWNARELGRKTVAFYDPKAGKKSHRDDLTKAYAATGYYD